MTTSDEFGRAARAFLEASAKPLPAERSVWGVGDDTMSSYAKRTAEQDAHRLREARRWKQLEFDAGFGWITGPPELGGAGLDAGQQRRYAEICVEYDVPATNVSTISLGMVAPAILLATSLISHGPSSCTPPQTRAATPPARNS